jgi:hypothetical protein
VQTLELRQGSHCLLQLSYTFAKSIMLDGMDFNNQFNFSNAHAPSLLDQRHRISVAGVYLPVSNKMTSSETSRALLSGWTLSTVMGFSSGRPNAGLLSPACTSSTLSFSNCNGANDNLNDTALNINLMDSFSRVQQLLVRVIFLLGISDSSKPICHLTFR